MEDTAEFQSITSYKTKSIANESDPKNITGRVH